MGLEACNGRLTRVTVNSGSAGLRSEKGAARAFARTGKNETPAMVDRDMLRHQNHNQGRVSPSDHDDDDGPPISSGYCSVAFPINHSLSCAMQ
jgi:hypothetical protein